MADSISAQVKRDFVKKQLCFAQLNASEIEELATLLTEETVKAGETIVTEGDHVDSVYLIVSGEADVRVTRYKNGQPQTQSVAKLGKDQSIGLNETGFYSLTGLRTATVVALTDMVLLRLSVTEFHGFTLSHSHASEVMRKNAEKLQE